MGKSSPGHIALAPDEDALFASIREEALSDEPFSDGYCGKVTELLRRLKARGAIPAVRLRYFTDADLNIGLRKSRQQVFVDNGCDTYEKILTSGNFFRYLEYFIAGPRLPQEVVSRFSELTAGPFQDFEQLRTFVRAQARRLSGSPLRDYLGEEFFKLAIECDLERVEARMIRTEAMNAVSRARRRS